LQWLFQQLLQQLRLLQWLLQPVFQQLWLLQRLFQQIFQQLRLSHNTNGNDDNAELA
jgi:hypothetical protein